MTQTTVPLSSYLGNVRRLSEDAARHIDPVAALTNPDLRRILVIDTRQAMAAAEALDTGEGVDGVLELLLDRWADFTIAARHAAASGVNAADEQPLLDRARAYRLLRGEVVNRYGNPDTDAERLRLEEPVALAAAERRRDEIPAGLDLLGTDLESAEWAEGQVRATADLDAVVAASSHLSMEPTIVAVLITGTALGEPILTLHTRRQAAVENLRGLAQVLLSDLLGYVPVPVQGSGPLADPTAVIDTLAGYGYAARITEERVTL